MREVTIGERVWTYPEVIEAIDHELRMRGRNRNGHFLNAQTGAVCVVGAFQLVVSGDARMFVTEQEHKEHKAFLLWLERNSPTGILESWSDQTDDDEIIFAWLADCKTAAEAMR